MRNAGTYRFWKQRAIRSRRRGRWCRPLARLRESLRASKQLIQEAIVVREANDEATAAVLLFEALMPLGEASETLRRMCRLAALTPERAGDARILIQHLNTVWMDVATEMSISVGSSNDPAGMALLQAIVLPDVRLIPAQRPLNPVRLFLAEDISRANMRRFLAGTRRRRFVPSRITDAPRRVSRGRAPPALALCPL